MKNSTETLQKNASSKITTHSTPPFLSRQRAGLSKWSFLASTGRIDYILYTKELLTATAICAATLEIEHKLTYSTCTHTQRHLHCSTSILSLCKFCIFSLTYFTHQFHLLAMNMNREYWRISRASLPPAPRSERLRPNSHDPRWQLCPSVPTGLLCHWMRWTKGATVSHLAQLTLEQSTTVYEPDTGNENGKNVKLVPERCSTLYTSKPRMNETWKRTTWVVLEGSSLVSVVAESCKVLLEHLLTQRWCAQILWRITRLLIAIHYPSTRNFFLPLVKYYVKGEQYSRLLYILVCTVFLPGRLMGLPVVYTVPSNVSTTTTTTRY